MPLVVATKVTRTNPTAERRLDEDGPWGARVGSVVPSGMPAGSWVGESVVVSPLGMPAGIMVGESPASSPSGDGVGGIPGGEIVGDAESAIE